MTSGAAQREPLLFLRTGRSSFHVEQLYGKRYRLSSLGAEVVKRRQRPNCMVANKCTATMSAGDEALIFQRLQPLTQGAEAHPELLGELQFVRKNCARLEVAARNLSREIVTNLKVKGTGRTLLREGHNIARIKSTMERSSSMSDALASEAFVRRGRGGQKVIACRAVRSYDGRTPGDKVLLRVHRFRFAMRPTLIDESGKHWEPRSPVLRSRLRASIDDRDLAQFAILNLGFIALVADRDSVRDKTAAGSGRVRRSQCPVSLASPTPSAADCRQLVRRSLAG